MYRNIFPFHFIAIFIINFLETQLHNVENISPVAPAKNDAAENFTVNGAIK